MQKHAIGVKLKENLPHLKLESLPTYDEDLVSSRRGAALSLRYLEKKDKFKTWLETRNSHINTKTDDH